MIIPYYRQKQQGDRNCANNLQKHLWIRKGLNLNDVHIGVQSWVSILALFNLTVLCQYKEIALPQTTPVVLYAIVSAAF